MSDSEAEEVLRLQAELDEVTQERDKFKDILESLHTTLDARHFEDINEDIKAYLRYLVEKYRPLIYYTDLSKLANEIQNSKYGESWHGDLWVTDVEIKGTDAKEQFFCYMGYAVSGTPNEEELCRGDAYEVAKFILRRQLDQQHMWDKVLALEL